MVYLLFTKVEEIKATEKDFGCSGFVEPKEIGTGYCIEIKNTYVPVLR